MKIWHKHLQERFSTFPSHQQIIMVANELNRANHHEHNVVEYKACLERALELLDFTIDDKDKWGGKYRELLRARRYLASIYNQPDTFIETSVLQRCLIQLDVQAWRLTNPQRKDLAPTPSVHPKVTE